MARDISDERLCEMLGCSDPSIVDHLDVSSDRKAALKAALENKQAAALTEQEQAEKADAEQRELARSIDALLKDDWIGGLIEGARSGSDAAYSHLVDEYREDLWQGRKHDPRLEQFILEKLESLVVDDGLSELDQRNLKMAEEVGWLIAEGGYEKRKKAAYDKVAARHGVGWKTVKNAYATFRPGVRNMFASTVSKDIAKKL